jgi:hemoglobin
MPIPATPEAVSVPSEGGPSLYDRLGGLPAIRAVMGAFHERVMADSRINAFFRGVNWEDLGSKLVDQVCQATGGPCVYRGRSMRDAHRGMNLTNAHFDALVENLVGALNQFNVPERERNELVAALARMRGDIVGR